MPLTTGPCQSWPLDLECCKLPDDTNPTLIAKWLAVATKILWAWSGRRIGLCEVAVRPCKKSCMEPGITTPWGFVGPYMPYVDSSGAWRNATCGCTSDCHCGAELCEIYLPGSPVHDVVEVTIDGQVIDPATYRVDAAGRLVRQALPAATAGGGPDAECWPSCQDMSRPAGDHGTFVVRYRWGVEPDAAAIAAVSELTCHLVRACLPTGADCPPCALPGNVRRVVRQGVAVEVSDPTTIFTERRTNLPTVDMWLQAENPHGLAYPPRVLSPDFRRPRVTQWP